MAIPLLSSSHNSRVSNAFLTDEVLGKYVGLLLFPCTFSGILNLPTDVLYSPAKFGAIVRKCVKNKQTSRETAHDIIFRSLSILNQEPRRQGLEV
jgi:hypothetical protein